MVDPEKPAKVVRFHVADPNSCSLKYDETGLLLRRMLEKSKIEPKEPVDNPGS